MRILIVTNMYPTEDTPFYGIFVKEQMNAMTHQHPDVEYDVHFVDGRTNKLNYLKSIREVDRRIASGGYDLVHIHYGLSGLFLLNPFRHKIPVVLTLHGGDIQADQGKTVQVALTKRIIKRVDAVIALNDKMTAICSRFHDNIHQLPCSVNTNVFTPPQYDLRERRPGEPVRIIFPSSPLRTIKNYPLFKETVELLKSKHGLNVTEFHLDNMTRQEIAETLQNAHLLLMTSISEGSPQVVKEAMATNLPVVTTNVGDVSFLLKNVRNSRIAESTPEALANGVMQILSGDDNTGVKGRDRILDYGLNDEAVGDRLYNIYSSVLDSNKR